MAGSDNSERGPVKSHFQVPMPNIGLLRFRRLIIVGAHVGVWFLALLLSFLMTNNMQFRTDWFAYQFPGLLACVIAIKFFVFLWLAQYKGWWRYAGISDLLAIAKGSLISTSILVVGWVVCGNVESIRPVLGDVTEVSQGVFLLDMFLSITLLGGLRLFVRLYYEEFRTVESGRLSKLLIVGAGNAGEALLREIHRMPVVQYEVTGFIDDDPAKQGTSIHGINVLGTVERLPDICREQQIDEIAIAMPGATHQQLRRVIQVAGGTKIKFRTVPSITDIASGKLKVSQIRDVDINDLLGRDVVQLDLDQIENFLRDKVIMVTGAGGSIGSEMCRQVCNWGPKLLLLVEQAENALFYIDQELRRAYPNVPMRTVICDIADSERVDRLFDKYRPQVVIHAAAHKHVPLMELNPGEAIKNNIGGTRNISSASHKYGVTNFVMISTDKAVNPTSIMGSTKRIAEMFVQDLNRTSNTHFITVRFGNVLGSNGSVVPIFKQQIAAGGPVTVTHPEMRRYFMTIPEASQLVLQAATLGKGGEIFLLDMGEPVKIVDLARELITLSGFRPGEDIEIKFSGLRPGEKLFEELSIKGEDMLPTCHPKIAIWKNLPMDRERLYAGIEELIKVSQSLDKATVISKIKLLVPEFISESQVLQTKHQAQPAPAAN